jgi:hypothetical protein
VKNLVDALISIGALVNDEEYLLDVTLNGLRKNYS